MYRKELPRFLKNGRQNLPALESFPIEKTKIFALGIEDGMLWRSQPLQRPFPVRFIFFILLSHWPGRSGSSALMHQLLPMGSIPGPAELKNSEIKVHFPGCPGILSGMASYVVS